MRTEGPPPDPDQVDGAQAAETAVTRTFLIADVRGYTSFTQSHGDEAAGHLAARFAGLARAAVTATGGEVIELRGDEALCVFHSARQALRAAVELQMRFRQHVEGQPAFPLGVGIGLAAGEAVPVEGGYRGGALNLASRLCNLASGGQILASETVTSLAGMLEGVRFVERRRTRLKGLEKPVRVIEVVPEVELPALPEAPRGHRPRPLLFGAAGAVILAGAITAASIELTGGGGGTTAALSAVVPDSLAVVDPKTNGIVGQVHIPGRPSLVTAGRRFVWVASDASRTVSSIASDKRAVGNVVAPNATPSALTAEGDAVWMFDGTRRILLKIDPAYEEPTRRIALPRAPPLPATNRRLSSLSVFFGAHALWVTDGSSRLLRVEPESGRVQALDVHHPLDDVAVSAGAVWAVSGPAASLFKIDRHARAIETRIRIVNRLGATAPFPVAVAVGEGSVWVVNANTQTVSRIDPEFDSVTATIPLGIGRNPSDIATGGDAVWVANSGNGTLARIDPSTNSSSAIPLGNRPTSVAVGGGRVWVSVQPGFRAIPSSGAEPASALEPETLPASRCSPVEFEGKGQPRYLIASDLPFQGQSSLAETLQMSDAVRFVLAQHHFRAGRYSVGYQSCDDSIAATGSYDSARCKANAQAYAATKSVIGVIGGYNSGCVQAQLAVLARARDGPLAVIGTASTYVGLTHAGPGTARGEPQKYHPGGKRSYVRVVAADDIQGAADAILANRLGVTRLYVLHDGDPYGFGIASDVRHAATKLGVRIAGFERWDPHARTYGALARRVRRTGADGVFLGGSVDISNGPALVKDLRAALGQRVHILLPDGFSPISAFAQLAGPAAEGITVSLPAPAPDRVRGAGRRFVADFRKAIGRPVETYSVTAAQATEVLLDSIARSDGTRASVTRQLFKTKIKNGILGSFSFDRKGDTTAGAMTIYRVVSGRPRVLSVITPSPSLVR
ncbi:MAG TPA: ABC transporter substrate-binding protein [Gaiellaceae bacterium]|jgi:branched-chain amino acid transport system substrate-binding protein